MEDERKSTHMDFQFQVIVFDRAEYENDKAKASSLDSYFGGVEFGNSWKEGIEFCKREVARYPDQLLLLTDRMNRKQPLEITHGKELENV